MRTAREGELPLAWQHNTAELCGVVGGEPTLSHISRGIWYESFPLLASRLSGTVDRLNVILPAQLAAALPKAGERACILGELRSFNNRSGSGSRLVLYVHGQEVCVSALGEEDRNEVTLSGTLCRAPAWRRTPMGREICDLMLAVPRRYGRADYIPCIAWGRNAEQAAGWERGRAVDLSGRFQSRSYTKLESGVPAERTAFEVSVTAFAEDPF